MYQIVIFLIFKPPTKNQKISGGILSHAFSMIFSLIDKATASFLTGEGDSPSPVTPKYLP